MKAVLVKITHLIAVTALAAAVAAAASQAGPWQELDTGVDSENAKTAAYRQPHHTTECSAFLGSGCCECRLLHHTGGSHHTHLAAIAMMAHEELYSTALKQNSKRAAETAEEQETVLWHISPQQTEKQKVLGFQHKQQQQQEVDAPQTQSSHVHDTFKPHQQQQQHRHHQQQKEQEQQQQQQQKQKQAQQQPEQEDSQGEPAPSQQQHIFEPDEFTPDHSFNPHQGRVLPDNSTHGSTNHKPHDSNGPHAPPHGDWYSGLGSHYKVPQWTCTACSAEGHFQLVKMPDGTHRCGERAEMGMQGVEMPQCTALQCSAVFQSVAQLGIGEV
jgi:hypothetical protein